MWKKIGVSIFCVLLVTLVWAHSGVAQEEPGYPIDPETPAPTEPPIETKPPTQPPTQPLTQPPTEAPVETTIPTVAPTAEPTNIPLPTETAPPEPDPTVAAMANSPVCTFARVHPALYSLSLRHSLPYETLVGYTCENQIAIGEIALATLTLDRIPDPDVTLDDLLNLRLDADLGWGEIWRLYGLGRSIDSSDPSDAVGSGFQPIQRRQRQQNQSQQP